VGLGPCLLLNEHRIFVPHSTDELQRVVTCVASIFLACTTANCER